MIQALLGAFFKATLGALVDALNAYRRDQALKELGHAEEQRNAALASLDAANRMGGVKGLDRDASVSRLRSGDF